MPSIAIVDTTFSRVNMGRVARETLEDLAPDATLHRDTVPGVKDLPAASRKHLDEGVDLVIACGMVGPEEVDKTCGHEASLGLMALRVLFGKPVLEVFVHMDEVEPGDEEGLAWLARERTREHAENAYWMLYEPGELRRQAGTGQRQGFEDAGPVGGDAGPAKAGTGDGGRA